MNIVCKSRRTTTGRKNIMQRKVKTMEKYDIEIAGIAMTVKTDENEDFVGYVVSELDHKINSMVARNLRCSKTEAAILCALEYNCERARLDKKLKNLEAQVALYSANVNRLKEENTELKKQLGISE